MFGDTKNEKEISERSSIHSESKNVITQARLPGIDALDKASAGVASKDRSRIKLEGYEADEDSSMFDKDNSLASSNLIGKILNKVMVDYRLTLEKRKGSQR